MDLSIILILLMLNMCIIIIEDSIRQKINLNIAE
jgi:hypothetical protein